VVTGISPVILAQKGFVGGITGNSPVNYVLGSEIGRTARCNWRKSS
jgi:hypothetical protein